MNLHASIDLHHILFTSSLGHTSTPGAAVISVANNKKNKTSNCFIPFDISAANLAIRNLGRSKRFSERQKCRYCQPLFKKHIYTQYVELISHHYTYQHQIWYLETGRVKTMLGAAQVGQQSVLLTNFKNQCFKEILHHLTDQEQSLQPDKGVKSALSRIAVIFKLKVPHIQR